jgi:formate/nitrite transporter FocA (FNT family)
MISKIDCEIPLTQKSSYVIIVNLIKNLICVKINNGNINGGGFFVSNWR